MTDHMIGHVFYRTLYVDNYRIQSIVHRIFSGKQILFFNNTLLELVQPSIELKIEADMIYQQAYDNHRFDDNIILEDYKFNYMVKNGILEPGHQDHMKALEKRLKAQKKSLYKEYFNVTQRNKNKNQIKSTKKIIQESESLLNLINFLVLEHQCDNYRNEFLIKNTLYNKATGKLFFQEQNIDSTIFNNIMQLISQNILSIAEYKSVARSDYWRGYYTNNKNHLFDVNSKDYTDEQRAILNISVMYDRIYEHPDCPGEDIINDDDALDGWMIDQKDKNKEEKNAKGVSNKKGALVGGAQEIFIPADENKETIDNIYGMNTTEGLSTIQQRNQQLSQSDGSIRHKDLKDVQSSINEQLKQLNYNRK